MMEAKNKHFQIKPIQTWKAVTIYILCIVLVAGLLVGNYFADAYRDLITVYLSGSGTVTTEDSEALCLEIQQEGMVLLKNEGGLPLKENARVTLLGQSSADFVYGGAGSGSVDTSAAADLREAMEEAGFTVNPTLWDFYTVGAGRDYRKEVPDETGDGDFQVNEVPRDLYTNTESPALPSTAMPLWFASAVPAAKARIFPPRPWSPDTCIWSRTRTNWTC